MFGENGDKSFILRQLVNELKKYLINCFSNSNQPLKRIGFSCLFPFRVILRKFIFKFRPLNCLLKQLKGSRFNISLNDHKRVLSFLQISTNNVISSYNWVEIIAKSSENALIKVFVVFFRSDLFKIF